MSVFEKYNRVSKFPSYKVEYAKAKDYLDDGAHPVTFIGINNHSKYGDHRQPYVDILSDDNNHIRVNVSSFYADDFDKIIHDNEAMQEVEAGKVSVSFKSTKTKAGNDFILVEWIDR